MMIYSDFYWLLVCLLTICDKIWFNFEALKWENLVQNTRNGCEGIERSL